MQVLVTPTTAGEEHFDSAGRRHLVEAFVALLVAVGNVVAAAGDDAAAAAEAVADEAT